MEGTIVVAKQRRRRSNKRRHRPAETQSPTRSERDLLFLHHASNSRTLEHAVLEPGVILKLVHRELAANAPGVEDEAIRIDHRILVGKPFAPRQHAIALLQLAVEGLAAGFLEGGKSRWIARVALGSADMGMRGMHARCEEHDRGWRFRFGYRV